MPRISAVGNRKRKPPFGTAGKQAPRLRMRHICSVPGRFRAFPLLILPTSTAIDIRDRFANTPPPSSVAAATCDLDCSEILRRCARQCRMARTDRSRTLESPGNSFPIWNWGTGFVAGVRERGCTRWERETSKNSRGHSRVGDRREDSHASATFRTGKRIDLEDTLQDRCSRSS